MIMSQYDNESMCQFGQLEN